MERIVTKQILFSKDRNQYNKLRSTTNEFLNQYCKDTAIKDSVFTVIENYARQNGVKSEVLRYPFHDNNLWAVAFIKEDTVFICINTDLLLCQQLFAAAHELYHVICYVDDSDPDTLRNGSLLKRETVDEISGNDEELEANAFASMLLMPEEAVREQIQLQGIDVNQISLESILMMMDTFAMPYKACVLRMFECGYIEEETALELYGIDDKEVNAAISRYGKARIWNRNGNGTESFGSLFEAFHINAENEYLTPSRKEEDRGYITKLREQFNIDPEAYL